MLPSTAEQGSARPKTYIFFMVYDAGLNTFLLTNYAKKMAMKSIGVDNPYTCIPHFKANELRQSIKLYLDRCHTFFCSHFR